MFSEDKPKSRSPCQRPRSPAVLAGRARCAQLPPLGESRRSCSNYRPYSISDLFAFNAECRLFLSPRVLSPSHTHSHILRSFSPALPFALWGKAIGRNDSPSGKQPPTRTSRVPWLSQVPGLQRGGVAGEVRGGKVEALSSAAFLPQAAGVPRFRRPRSRC